MKCKEGSCNKFKVNKHFDLCLECNNERLYGNKYGKQYKGLQSKPKPFINSKKPKKFPIKKKSKSKKSLFTSNLNLKDRGGLTRVEKDELFYEECFNNCIEHKCEECSKALPTNFRDDEGFIVARYRYSHIIPKSIASHLRHDLSNINHLCATCHTQWDHGDKEKMKIYLKNAKKFPNYLKIK